MMTAAAPARQLAPGAKLDRYELICPLAEGGMAQIWVARLRGKQGLDTLFAVKVLSPRLADEPEARKMLLDEARIAARIRHPHVAQIIELGESEGIWYLVLEWVDGESLSVLRRAAAAAARPFPIPIALSVLAHASAGLHAAHELADDDGTPLGVVHRDVSPQNILVGAAGEVKVIDFGIAKAKRRFVETTRQGDIKGKLQYMAPEQVGRDEVDRRADVWGVGAVLYQLIAGRSPFEGHDELSTLRLLLARERPPRIDGIAPELARILDRSLAPDPDDRFATAEELSHALEDAARAEGGVTTPREIARFVEELIGKRLSQRRAIVKNACAGRPGVIAVSQDLAETRRETPRAGDQLTAPTERVSNEDATGASTAQTLPAVYRQRERARRRLLAGAVAAVALVVALIGAAMLRSARDLPVEASSSNGAPVSPKIDSARAPSPPPEPVPQSSALAPSASSTRATSSRAWSRKRPSGATTTKPATSSSGKRTNGSYTDIFDKPK